MKKFALIPAVFAACVIPLLLMAQGGNPGVRQSGKVTKGNAAIWDNTTTGAAGGAIKDGGAPATGTVTSQGASSTGGTVTITAASGANPNTSSAVFNFDIAAGNAAAVRTVLGITSIGTAAVGQIPGSTGNTVAAAGNIGEVISINVAAGSSVSLTNNVAADVTRTTGATTLTAGHWAISGTVCFTGGTGTTISYMEMWVSATAATPPTFPNGGAFTAHRYATTNSSSNDPICFGTGSPLDVYLSGNTNYSLSAIAGFGVSTLNAYGFFRALRVQ